MQIQSLWRWSQDRKRLVKHFNGFYLLLFYNFTGEMHIETYKMCLFKSQILFYHAFELHVRTSKWFINGKELKIELIN